MSRREDLNTLLRTVATHVYFQPPETIKMEYPCIVYARSMGNTIFAEDKPYRHEPMYQVTVISRDPDDALLDKVAMLPKCLFVRHFVVNNLNHDVYNLYY